MTADHGTFLDVNTAYLRVTMLDWLLWATLFSFSTQEPCPAPGVLLCGPQNVTESHDYTYQNISITWEDDPSSSRVQGALIYEVEILLTDNLKEVHHDAVDVRPDQAGIKHQWTWTSPLPLECANHSVRLRSRYLNYTSQWSPLQNISGKAPLNYPQVFPEDKVYEAGSNFTFCCILGLKTPGVSMKYRRNTMKPIHISGQSYAMTIHMAESVPECMPGTCEDPGGDVGACAFVGYRPDDRDLVCETCDLETAECYWKTGKPTNLKIDWMRTIYHLNGGLCPKGTISNCKQQVNIGPGEINLTLTAKNPLGSLELRETADLRKRVRMIAPVNVTASNVNARSASLEWRWKNQRYKTLQIVCQVQLSNNGYIDTRNYSGEGLGSIVLHGLTPAQRYTVKVRCGNMEHFWKWGDYNGTTFQTKEDIPDALDVWMKIERNQTMIVWKPLLENQRHGQIQDYEVTWERPMTNERRSATIHPQSSKLHPIFTHALGATGKEYIVTVTARNLGGSSAPSTITIPSLLPERVVNTTEVLGSNGGFDLSWVASPTASHGYVVDWCPIYSECTVDWMKVPAGVTRARIQSSKGVESLEDGVKYTVSIYAFSLQRAPELLERREGYVKECIPNGTVVGLTERRVGSGVEISWTGIPPKNQTAFILGYHVTYFDSTLNTSHSVTTDGPDATSVTVQNLHSQSYLFTVRARTSVGMSKGSTITVYMQSDQFVMVTILYLAAAICLLTLATIVCCKNRKWFKQELYPDIPKPVWNGDWVIPAGRCQVLPTDSCPNSEIEIVGDPGQSAEPVEENGDGDQEMVALMNTNPNILASQEYCNQSQNNSIPAPKTSTSSPHLTVYEFRGIEIQNPLYKALEVTKTERERALDYQPHMGPILNSESQLGSSERPPGPVPV